MLFVLNVAPKALADEPNDGQSVSFSVPSKVKKQKSKVDLSSYSVLANFQDYSILTVKLRDEEDKPAKDIKVLVSSNRGAIDKIEFIEANNGDMNVATLSLLEVLDANSVGITDSYGKAFFKISSSVAGKAEITILADNVVKFEPLEVIFEKIPFTEEITISIEVPKIFSKDGKIILFSPNKHDETEVIDCMFADCARSDLVDRGVELSFSFGIFLLIVIIISIIITLIVFATLNFRKVRKLEEKEIKILMKEEKLLEDISENKCKDK